MVGKVAGIFLYKKSWHGVEHRDMTYELGSGWIRGGYGMDFKILKV